MKTSDELKAAKAEAQRYYSNLTGVEGFGISGDGEIHVYVSDPELMTLLDSVEVLDVPLKPILTGPIMAGG